MYLDLDRKERMLLDRLDMDTDRMLVPERDFGKGRSGQVGPERFRTHGGADSDRCSRKKAAAPIDFVDRSWGIQELPGGDAEGSKADNLPIISKMKLMLGIAHIRLSYCRLLLCWR